MRLLLIGLVAGLALAAPARASGPVDTRETMPTGPLIAGQLVTDTDAGGEPLGSATPVKGLRLKSPCTNTAAVTFGGPSVDFVSAPGWVLMPCDEEPIPVDNVDDVYVDSGASSVTVEFYGVQGP